MERAIKFYIFKYKMDSQKKFIDVFNLTRANDFILKDFKMTPRLNRWLLGMNNISPSVISFGDILLVAKNKNTDVAVKFFYLSDSLDGDMNKDQFIALRYEYLVYRLISKNIIATKQCPNFIAFLGMFRISLKNAHKMLTGGISADILFQYKEKLISQGYATREKLENEDIRGVLTQRPPNSIQLYQWMRKFANVDNFMELYLPILFQILYCLCVLNVHKIMHNDLHSGNILISTLDKKVKLKYKVSGVNFEIKTQHIVYIFDWDRAYIESLGPNPLNEGELCDTLNMCNKWNPFYDLYTILCSLDFLGVKNIFEISPTIFTKDMESDEKMELTTGYYKYYAVPLFIKPEKIEKFQRDMNNNTKIILDMKQDKLKSMLTEESFDRIKDINRGFFIPSEDFSKIYLYNKDRCRLNFDLDNKRLPTPWELILFYGIFNQYQKNDIIATYSITFVEENNDVPREISAEDFELDEQSHRGESLQREEEYEYNDEEADLESNERLEKEGQQNESHHSVDAPQRRTSATRDPPFG